MSEAIIDITTRQERSQKTPAKQMPETDFVLRVLSGTQADAQIPLRAARYRIGADEECDIVLIDESVIAYHLNIFFADGCLSITQAQAPVYIDGAPAINFPADLAPMQIFLIGGVALAFGPENGDWPSQNTISEAIHAAHADVEDKHQAAQLPALHQIGLPAMLMTLGRQKLGLGKIENIIKLSFGMAAAISLMIIMISISLHSTENPISITHSAADRLQAHIQSDPAFAYVQLVNAEPQKKLTGYVARTADLNRLRNFARIAHTNLNIISMERLKKSINVLASLYSAHLAYKLTTSEGRHVNLLLYGIMRSVDDREKIRNQIKRDLPAIIQIKTDIITRNEAIGNISTWLAQYPNFSGLAAKINERGVTIQGNLLGNFRKSWQQALIKNPPKLPQNMKPQNDVHFGPYFPGKVTSLVTGNNAQIRLSYKDPKSKNKNQTQLAGIGAVLKGNFILKEISLNRITLKWHNRDFIYPIPD